jgi:hypothetical protein
MTLPEAQETFRRLFQGWIADLQKKPVASFRSCRYEAASAVFKNAGLKDVPFSADTTQFDSLPLTGSNLG